MGLLPKVADADPVFNQLLVGSGGQVDPDPMVCTPGGDRAVWEPRGPWDSAEPHLWQLHLLPVAT